MGFVIPNPCVKKWTELVGDEARRYCGDCGKFVYAVEGRSDAELVRMGSFCGYVRGETAGPPQSRRMVVAGAILTTISPLLAQNGRLRVEVRGAGNGVVPGAVVRVANRELMTDEAGIASFSGLPAGRYEVQVDRAGYGRWTGTYTAGAGIEPVVQVVLLESITVGGGTVVVEPKATTGGEDGRIRLAVLDPAGKPLAGAKVTVDCGEKRLFHGYSGSDGVAFMTELPETKCTLAVTAAGFQPWQLVRDIPGRGDGHVTAKLALPVHEQQVEVRPSAGRRFWNWMTSCTRR